ncbi:hypothetical protein CYMTET_31930, partial [Cymbomonas tetramitiformis]
GTQRGTPQEARHVPTAGGPPRVHGRRPATCPRQPVGKQVRGTGRAGLGYNVFQTDTDVVWWANPYPALKSLHWNHQIVMQNEGLSCPGANGGVLYSHRAQVGGPAHWTLGEMFRRVAVLARRPEMLQVVAPTAFPPGWRYTPAQLQEMVRRATDEQDLLNDVVASAFLGRKTHYFSTRAMAGDQEIPFELWRLPAVRDRRRRAWRRANQLALSWWRSDMRGNTSGAGAVLRRRIMAGLCLPQARGPQGYSSEAELRVVGCAAFAECGIEAVGAEECEAAQRRSTTVAYRPLVQVPGQQVREAAESAAAAPQWLFGGQASVRRLSQRGCHDVSTPPRQSWQDRLPQTDTIVHHLVGPPHEARELLMRALGAWHYYPVDMVHNVFPLDASRVLALGPVPPTGLQFLGPAAEQHAKIVRLIRRLMALAAVAERTMAMPPLGCEGIVEREDIVHDLPCPLVSSNASCCLFLPGGPSL